LFPETQSAYHPRAQRSAFRRRGVHQQRRSFTRYEVALTFAFAVVEESVKRTHLAGFEAAAAKYAWLNNVVAVGVYRSDLGKIAYRIYRIL
jgi:hypothetical protein